jgi:toxin ParE1/3/4
VKNRPVILRERARRDVDEAIAHYLTESGEKVALDFIAALEQAFAHIKRFPASGSPRLGVELSLPGLRSWKASHYPHLTFYAEGTARIEVWRVLHESRDIPASMQPLDFRKPEAG